MHAETHYVTFAIDRAAEHPHGSSGTYACMHARGRARMYAHIRDATTNWIVLSCRLLPVAL